MLLESPIILLKLFNILSSDFLVLMYEHHLYILNFSLMNMFLILFPISSFFLTYFKNSLKTKKKEWIGSYFMQECAYALMFQEMTGIPVKQLVTLIAVVDGPPQVFLEKTSDHVEDLSKAIKKYQKMIKIA